MNKNSAIQKINHLAGEGRPFLLVTDFKCAQNHVVPIDEVDPHQLLYDINGVRNFSVSGLRNEPVLLTRVPNDFFTYKAKFEQVHDEISRGNTYLLNLTQPTTIETQSTLKDIFHQSKAKYKLWFQDQFVVFSPEIFVQIKEGKMASYPMKGTIDAEIDDAERIILSSAKEMAEHATIVDLIRNDMSQYLTNVNVERFRYIDEIRTNQKHLLQISSKITGKLPVNYLDQLGEMIYSLLPAGSICGAPKKRTLEIIDDVEGYDRGYYTGIVGLFDGKNFDSGVMIRFIEKKDNELIYKSGGGIHFLSDCEAEYQEMIDKIYVPVY